MAAADEPTWEELHAKLHRWAGLLRTRGVAALLDSISATEALPRRVLARLGGERRLTDLGHVGQLLHAAADRAATRDLLADRLAAPARSPTPTGTAPTRIAHCGSTRTPRRCRC